MRRATAESESVLDTRRVGAAIGRAVERVPRAGLTIVLLGDLGAGKTVLAGGIVVGLGTPAGTVVSSPTFTIARGYRGRMPIIHMDAYQIRTRADLEAAGFEEMGGDGRVTVVEWGDRIAAALPPDRLEVTLRTIPPPSQAPESGGLPKGDAAASTDGESAGGTPALDVVASDPASARRRLEFVATGPESERVLARLRAAGVVFAPPSVAERTA